LVCGVLATLLEIDLWLADNPPAAPAVERHLVLGDVYVHGVLFLSYGLALADVVDRVLAEEAASDRALRPAVWTHVPIRLGRLLFGDRDVADTPLEIV
jgi:hypothetical protein